MMPLCRQRKPGILRSTRALRASSPIWALPSSNCSRRAPGSASSTWAAATGCSRRSRRLGCRRRRHRFERRAGRGGARARARRARHGRGSAAVQRRVRRRVQQRGAALDEAGGSDASPASTARSGRAAASSPMRRPRLRARRSRRRSSRRWTAAASTGPRCVPWYFPTPATTPCGSSGPGFRRQHRAPSAADAAARRRDRLARDVRTQFPAGAAGRCAGGVSPGRPDDARAATA